MFATPFAELLPPPANVAIDSTSGWATFTDAGQVDAWIASRGYWYDSEGWPRAENGDRVVRVGGLEVLPDKLTASVGLKDPAQRIDQLPLATSGPTAHSVCGCETKLAALEETIARLREEVAELSELVKPWQTLSPPAVDDPPQSSHSTLPAWKLAMQRNPRTVPTLPIELASRH